MIEVRYSYGSFLDCIRPARSCSRKARPVRALLFLDQLTPSPPGDPVSAARYIVQAVPPGEPLGFFGCRFTVRLANLSPTLWTDGRPGRLLSLLVYDWEGSARFALPRVLPCPPLRCGHLPPQKTAPASRRNFSVW